MRGDIGVPGATTLEMRPIENSDQRRLVVHTDGIRLKIDLTPLLVFALMDECLDALVDHDSEMEACESCKETGSHARDCVLVETLQNALKALRRRGT